MHLALRTLRRYSGTKHLAPLGGISNADLSHFAFKRSFSLSAARLKGPSNIYEDVWSPIEEAEIVSESEDEEYDVRRCDQRTASVGLVGAPNAGKSALTNAFVQAHVTAVSRKTNTTRKEMLGAVTRGDTQLLLWDTPGVVGEEHYKDSGQGGRVQSAWATARDTDIVLFVVDGHRQIHKPDPRVERLVEQLARRVDKDGIRMPSALVVNKIDLLKKEVKDGSVKALVNRLCELHNFDHVFQTAAIRRKGTEEVVSFLLRHARLQEWLLPPDTPTDLSHEELAEEFVREAILDRINKRLPYQVEIIHVKYKKRKGQGIYIEQELLVSHSRELQILVGKDAQVVKAISEAASSRLEKAIGIPVFIRLQVKVAKKHKNYHSQSQR